jgi:hypothetical protein
MKLIIVERSKMATFTRLRQQFADDPNVKVVWERRKSRSDAGGSEDERRRLQKAFNGRDYVVIHSADDDLGHHPQQKE